VDAILTSEENKPGREWLSERMGSYWAEFARHGDPGRGTAGDLPHWTPWDDTSEASERFIVFDTEAGGGVRMSSEYVTAERIAARLHADSRFTAEERCEGLARLEDTFPRYRSESAAVACLEPGFIEIGN
jgi:para-nitrobenzyl esterase